MPMSCCASRCRNRFSPGLNVSLFSFPRNREMRDKWVDAMDTQDVKVTRNTKICSEHFVPEDFKVHTDVKILSSSAIPSVFPNNTSKRRSLSEEPPEKLPNPILKKQIEKAMYCRLCANSGGETVAIFSAEEPAIPYQKIIEKYLSVKINREDLLPLDICIACADILVAFNKLAEEAIEAENKLRLLLIESSNVKENSPAVEEQQPVVDTEDIAFFDELKPFIEKKRVAAKKDGIRKTKLLRLSEAEKARKAIPSAWLEILSCNQCNTIGTKPFTPIGSAVTINCAQCGLEVTGIGNYINHLKLHKNEKKLTERRTQGFACRKCGRGFSLNASADDHEKVCGLTDSFACEVCGKRFLSTDAVKSHAQAHNASCVCHLCGKQFNRPSSLNQHIRLKHENLTFICHVCGKSCRNKGYLREHIQHHTGEMDFTCQICGKGSTNAYSFSVHLATHTNEKPFKCSFCPKTFKHTKYVYIHERAVHCGNQGTQKKPSKSLADRMCDDCGLVFRRTSTLAVHRRTVHEGKKAYVCKICGKDFNYASVLCAHRRTRHFPELCKHKCPECEKVFATRGDLRRHQGKHTGDKRFECTPCGKRYAFSGSLSMHIRTHHKREKLKKLPCEHCGAVFNFPSHLQRHMASHVQ